MASDQWRVESGELTIESCKGTANWANLANGREPVNCWRITRIGGEGVHFNGELGELGEPQVDDLAESRVRGD